MSREKWLRSSFPKFSSRSRGKPVDVVPPPHTMYNRGRCNLEIGPHVFYDTTIFEVHYHSVHVSAPANPTASNSYQPGSGSSSQAATQPNRVPYSAYGQQSEANSTSSPAAPSTTSTPLLSSLTSVVTITPALIAQVNSAATSNPTLANLLQLAAAGKANADQLKTLGLLIQSLAISPAMDIGSTPASRQSTPQPVASSTIPAAAPKPTVPGLSSSLNAPPPVKDFDLVIEFREVPTERWIFPRGPVLCNYTPTPGYMVTTGDITVSTIAPFPVSTAVNTPSTSQPANPPLLAASEKKEVVSFRFSKASSAVWDSFSRWVGPKEKIEENRKALAAIETPERVFLAHQLAEGTKLTQVQNAAAPILPTKPIKPTSETYKPKRRAPKKPPADGEASSAPPAKRRRPSQAKAAVPMSKIACFACGQTDVPLIMGGRYCRPCAEAGRGTNDVPQVGGASFTYRLPTHSGTQASLQVTTSAATSLATPAMKSPLSKSLPD
ncbi:hypothetical protein BV22DRAFT_62020 [Leucogyrophana mollusca]|uniref:Uncharacterized protein n=1 Tax=Leucogyrophana mollusca TaxID=85980 RepID=A0ACB8BXU3_9AGAM|nr:hypothetical protein BV22DRAFT_62020 [Leucogyrophana mollusca]